MNDRLTRSTSAGGWFLVAALVVDSIGNGLFLPLSLVFFLHLTDVPLATLGVLGSIANVVTLPLPVWVGAVSDRRGSLLPVVGAQLVQALGYLGFVLATEPLAILCALTFVAIGVRVFWAAIFALLADFADGAAGGSAGGASKESWFAWATITRTAGLTAGGLIAGLAVADGRDAAYRLVAYAAAACFLLAGLMLVLRVRVPRRQHRAHAAATVGYRELVRDRPFLSLTAINTVFALSSMMLALALPTVVLVGLRGPAWLPTAALLGNAVLVTVGTSLIVRRLQSFRRTRALASAAALWAAWSLLVGVAPPARPTWIIGLILGSTVLFTLAEAIHGPVSTALAEGLAPAEARGRYLASFQYSFAIAGALGPVYFAVLFEAHRALPWVALGLLNLGAVAAIIGLEPRLPVRALHTVDEGARQAGPQTT